MERDVPLSAVSYHAVTRYVQRVLGICVPVDEAEAGTLTCANLHCAAAGTTLDAVRRTILDRNVIAAIRSGLSELRTNSFRAIISNAVVVTIEPSRKRKNKMKRLGRSEGRRFSRQIERRWRSKPASNGVLP